MIYTKNLINIICDSEVTRDAWEDHIYLKAYNYFKDNHEKISIDDLLSYAAKQNIDFNERLWQLVATYPDNSNFNKYINYINQSNIEIAITIIDGLKDWPLSIDERLKLKIAAEKHIGHSHLYDKIIESL